MRLKSAGQSIKWNGEEENQVGRSCEGEGRGWIAAVKSLTFCYRCLWQSKAV